LLLYQVIEEDVRDLAHPLGVAFVVADEGIAAGDDGDRDDGGVGEGQLSI